MELPIASNARPCHRISPTDDHQLTKELFARNMAVILPEDFIPKDSAGGILRGAFLRKAQTGE